MPWTASDAERHTKLADTPAKQRQWAHVANGVLERTGNEARAIREANSVLHDRGSRDPAMRMMRRGRG